MSDDGSTGGVCVINELEVLHVPPRALTPLFESVVDALMHLKQLVWTMQSDFGNLHWQSAAIRQKWRRVGLSSDPIRNIDLTGTSLLQQEDKVPTSKES